MIFKKLPFDCLKIKKNVLLVREASIKLITTRAAGREFKTCFFEVDT